MYIQPGMTPEQVNRARAMAARARFPVLGLLLVPAHVAASVGTSSDVAVWVMRSVGVDPQGLIGGLLYFVMQGPSSTVDVFVDPAITSQGATLVTGMGGCVPCGASAAAPGSSTGGSSTGGSSTPLPVAGTPAPGAGGGTGGAGSSTVTAQASASNSLFGGAPSLVQPGTKIVQTGPGMCWPCFVNLLLLVALLSKKRGE